MPASAGMTKEYAFAGMPRLHWPHAPKLLSRILLFVMPAEAGIQETPQKVVSRLEDKSD
jgi:hypothetical protein